MNISFSVFFLFSAFMGEVFPFKRIALTRSNYCLFSSPEVFDEWSKKQSSGEGIKYNSIKVATLDGGLRGIIATKKIEGGSQLVTVSRDEVYEVTNARPPTPFAEFVPQDFWEQCMWDQRLALKVLADLFQLRVSAVSTKDKKPWLDQWPKTFSTPLHWDASVIQELQYSALENKLIAQKEAWTSFFNRWKSVTKPEYASRIKIDDVIYALECVNSRAFSGPYEGSSADERRALLLFTGALTLIWPLAGLGSIDQALSAALTIAVSIITRDAFLSRFGALKRYVICPYIDMFNHKSTSQSDVSYNYFLDQFELRTSSSYSEGEQIFISYGKQSNDRLLQFYGFVEEDNPFDYYDFGLTIVELLFKYGDRLSTDVAFPASPSPKHRLEFIASFLGSTATTSASQEKTSSTSSLSADGEKGGSGGDGTLRYYRDVRGPPYEGQVNKDLRSHFDEINVVALRLFFCSVEEWGALVDTTSRKISGRFNGGLSLETESLVSSVLRKLIVYELDSKPTLLEQDIDMLRTRRSRSADEGGNVKGFAKGGEMKKPLKAEAMDISGIFSDAKTTALLFRIEKKRLLLDASV